MNGLWTGRGGAQIKSPPRGELCRATDTSEKTGEMPPNAARKPINGPAKAGRCLAMFYNSPFDSTHYKNLKNLSIACLTLS